MIKTEKFVFNPFQENTYLLYDETGQCIVVDPGCQDEEECNKLVRYIDEGGLEMAMIVNTHCHVDHILGSSFLFNRYKSGFAVHGDDLFLLENAVDHALMFGFKLEEPPSPDTILSDNDEIAVGNSRLKVLHVPGHSPGSIALYSESGKFVLTGDLLFSGGIGRTDLPGGDYDTILKSIKEKILVLPEDVTVMPGHGSYTTVGDERRSNPFLG